MPQVINTNLPSLNSQRNLDKSSTGYATCLQRLSSGLRINSAADDAAGLAIATRMESNISGLTVAKRNSNDAISLSQIAEGALQETTNILQRIRELAVQSANGTNAAQDRYALNSEVNQLKDQLALSAQQTSFNGLKLLDGSLAAASFQIGPDQNQSVTISIGNTSTNQMGINDVVPTGTDGIEQANYGVYMEADVMPAPVVTALNGLTASNFIFDVQTNVAATLTVLPMLITVPNATVSSTANQINTTPALAGYVTASGYTDVLFSNFNYGSNMASFIFNARNSSGALTGAITIPPAANYSTIAMQINNSGPLAAIGVYAIDGPAGVRIISNQGHDFNFNATTSAVNSTNSYNLTQFDSMGIPLTSINNVPALTPGVVASYNTTVHGILGLEMSQNVILSTTKDSANQFFDALQTMHNSGMQTTLATNRLQAQTVTVSGNSGNVTIPILVNSTAASVATAINNQTGVTTVSATASTSVTMQNVSSTGTVTFSLYGDNTVTPVTINAAVTPTDYSNLVRTINDYSGTTGITAQANASSGVILSNTTGMDIRIANFQHSAGVVPQNVMATKLGLVDGSTLLVPAVASIDIVGNAASNVGGKTVTLFAGGARNQYDSTVVGGNVLLSSASSFSVSSSVDGTVYSGSLFAGAALLSHGSNFTSIAQIDISTSNGAVASLRVLDQALDQISSIRAELGAIQSRFDSIIRNIADSIENLSAAKSRVLDADFAAETAELSKTQILTQAGLSIVAQANTIPQSILTLLQ